ncbi:mandelate racemase/muconate lactonizing enzyme family protein [Rhodobacteraceae bacterium R_SAG7]|uniref:mandelate racemase/muconate lactonizing enzyme family protein n=1 Tax=Ruegeria sp. (strain TM1040) TaxID=292414 RepID=UPI0000553BA7|nr:mandelate racemase/muconate lactonizing enzyme family protein [Ruegeria sp. TM1040]ABF62367.1 Mandelate racemase/muconate lactonizing enzyme-like protein [Ruegeria sp. TM1040]NKW78049.1 mandelate racemase/muconate lactonizing enzyme family protein [Rhodobacteraceae bacterium R_SAG7]
MARITRVELRMIDLKPKVERVDAIQSFVSQETPIVTIHDSDGASGTGYSYTIGTGGPSVMALLEQTLVPALIGKDADRIDGIWRDLLFLTHATAVGPITSLALAAIDIALWDLRCKKMGLPLWKAAGGSRDRIPLYSTEGGWLHLETAALVEDALAMKEQGFRGSKIKIGRAHLSEDRARLGAIRAAVGDSYEIMTDANQGFTLSEAIRRAKVLEEFGIGWFEEPLPADDVLSHQELSRRTHVPIAVGESMYSLSQFKDYLQVGAAQIVQVDVARIGGITPWLKVAHLAEAHSVMVCPHFLMELHLPLVCAVPNAKWLEYIPQLDGVTRQNMQISNGDAVPSDEPGLGIDWDWDAITAQEIGARSIGGA